MTIGKGSQTGLWHRKRAKTTRGCRVNGKHGACSPRAATSLDEATFERLVWLSEALDVPVAQVIRDACDAYVHVVRSKADAVQIATMRRARILGDRQPNEKAAEVSPGGPGDRT